MDPNPRVNILLVDDQPSKLTTYEVILQQLGENLVKANTASEALRLLLQQEFAVVLMDVCMPDVDGFELARMIREHPRLERTAIILVSAVFNTDVDRLKGYDSGAVDYVPVPIIPEVLRAKVRVFADLYRKTEQLRALNIELEQRVGMRTTDLENTAADLRKSEERFRFLAETIPSMVWITALDGTVTYANRRWLEYRGLQQLPTGEHWPDIEVHAEDRPAWIEAWRAHLASGERFEIEARHRRPDGSLRWFLTRAEPRYGATGELICWFGVTTDIHDQKLMQQQLREADRRKDEFLALLSHELRNPLSPIRNAVHVMRRRGGTDPDLAWCRDVIERQTEHLTRLVDDLLDVSRITSGKVRLQRRPLTLDAVIATAIDTNRPLLEARQHTLVFEPPPAPVWVDGDAMRLGQVFANLVNNAAKYTEDHGRITIRIETPPRADGGHEAVVRVQDTGHGIATSLLPVVFNLFTQGDRTLDQAQGGLGVGLALVRSLVELHGGTVEARSEGVGHGSEFVVRLPLAPAPCDVAAPPVPDTAAKNRREASRVVLVVDDNADSADSLAILLRCTGHQAHTAGDGVAAIEAAERLRPDAVLLDLGMPRMNGYDAARFIRQQPWGKSMVLIAQTGWGQEEDRLRAAQAGFDVHLTKPVSADELLQLLVELPRAGVPARG
jgi:two-component system CheB/CheR fusion protein